MFTTSSKSDLQNDFSVDEKVISAEEETELALDEADRASAQSDIRYSSAEVFGRVRNALYNDLMH